MKPSFANQEPSDVENSYIVTFRDDDVGAGLEVLRNKAGIRGFAKASDFRDRVIPLGDISDSHGDVFDELNMCVVGCSKTAAAKVEAEIGRSAILAIEPDHRVFVIGSSVNSEGKSNRYLDSGNTTWGVSATGAAQSEFSGRGIRVAVLDTGVDSTHADFEKINLVPQVSFLGGEAIDGHGHGTHCTGILAGPTEPDDVPTYGVAPNAEVYVGKVVDDDGGGSVRQILAGLNWAIGQKCHVVSMSIGADRNSSATMFEEAGKRALQAGTLIVAAAGNNADRVASEYGFVVRPANSASILAVGAIDHELQTAGFSSRASALAGGEVDIAAPGVEVFSAWAGKERYQALSGTSMATPFVAGIAAMHAEASGERGRALWDVLLRAAKPLDLPAADVGAGLVRSP